MVVKIRVAGAEQMAALGVELRAAGLEGKVFRRRLLAAIRAAVAPAPAAAKASARANLPHGGGLNDYIASSRIGVRNRLTGKGVGVRVVATKGDHDLTALDEGTARHPVFGNRKVWSQNPVTPGWFTKPLEETSPRVTSSVIAAIYATRRALEGR